MLKVTKSTITTLNTESFFGRGYLPLQHTWHLSGVLAEIDYSLDWGRLMTGFWKMEFFDKEGRGGEKEQHLREELRKRQDKPSPNMESQREREGTVI